MKRIVLEHTETCWAAHYLDDCGRPDRYIERLFGSHILPTTYSPEYSAESVKRAVQRNWSDRIVSLAYKSRAKQ